MSARREIKVELEIAGRRYPFHATDQADAARLRGYADELNARIREKQNGGRIAPHDALVLASLTLVEELLESRACADGVGEKARGGVEAALRRLDAQIASLEGGGR